MNRSFLLTITTFICCIISIDYARMLRIPTNMEEIHRLRSEISKDLNIDMPDGSQISMSRCGFVHLDNNIDINSDNINQLRRSRSHNSDFSIPIAFHVIYASGGTGYVSESVVNEQVNVFNTSYLPWGISFILSSLDYTENSDWFNNDQANESQYKSQLAISPSTTLNIYTTTAEGYLGYAYLPTDFGGDESYYMHGVVLNYQSLPGLLNWQYDEGDTGVHEVGHYLGLLHTFGNLPSGAYGNCDVGDEVEDTPDQDGTIAENVYVCDENLNTCPDVGNDPVHNYMNYADDACLFEFTAGQKERMQFMLDNFRPSLGNSSCSQLLGDMNGNGEWQVTDIVILVNCVLEDNCEGLENDGCAADTNSDGNFSVLDIVLLINCVLTDTCLEDLGG